MQVKEENITNFNINVIKLCSFTHARVYDYARARSTRRLFGVAGGLASTSYALAKSLITKYVSIRHNRQEVGGLASILKEAHLRVDTRAVI